VIPTVVRFVRKYIPWVVIDALIVAVSLLLAWAARAISPPSISSRSTSRGLVTDEAISPSPKRWATPAWPCPSPAS